MVGHYVAQLAFLPSLAYTMLREKLGGRKWFNRIDNTVILGALPFSSMTDELVRNHNVRAVISLNEDYELRYFTNSRLEWEKYGVEFLQLRVADYFEAPNQGTLMLGLKLIHKHESLGHSVYVHCKAGRTRSATLVGCYLMAKYGLNPDQAIGLMRSKRNHIVLHQKHLQALREFYKTNVEPRLKKSAIEGNMNDGKMEKL